MNNLKQFIKDTPKKYWQDTLNILLICVGARNAYLEDSHVEPFGNMPVKYRNAIIRICETYNLKIHITDIDWMILRKNAKIPSSPKEMGRALGFPCPWEPAKRKIGVDFMIETEHGDTFVTAFFCSEHGAYIPWFQKMKKDSLALKPLFRKFVPKLLVWLDQNHTSEPIKIL